MRSALTAAYRGKVAAREVVDCAAQRSALRLLDRLHSELDGYSPSSLEYFRDDARGAPTGLRGILGRSAIAWRRSRTPRGAYLAGGVGVGKTMLMDLFHELAPLPQARKRRVHFHEFMLGVHDELHNLQQRARLDASARTSSSSVPAANYAPVSTAAASGALQRPQLSAITPTTASRWAPDWASVGTSTPAPDPVVAVARGIARESWLLCFDEFQVTDVADALLLRRLFQVLLDHGVVVVATSNRMPCELYQGGLNREAFLPFISLLEQRCELHVVDGERDFRRRNGGKASLAAVDADVLMPVSVTKRHSNGAVEYAPHERESVLEYGGTVGAAVGQATSNAKSTCSSKAKAGSSPLIGYHYCTHDDASDARACARDKLKAAFNSQCANGTMIAAGAMSNTHMLLQVRDNVRIAVSSGRHICVERAFAPPERLDDGDDNTVRAACAAWCSFKSLCGEPRGAADYLALAKCFGTLYLEGVPQLSLHAAAEARRFITLVDVLYERGVVLRMSADVPPTALFIRTDESELARMRDAQADAFEPSAGGAGDAHDARKDADGMANDRAVFAQAGDSIAVAGVGGSSGRSTTMIGHVEWSATGRKGVSMAGLGAIVDINFSIDRTLSRLEQMCAPDWKGAAIALVSCSQRDKDEQGQSQYQHQHIA